MTGHNNSDDRDGRFRRRRRPRPIRAAMPRRSAEPDDARGRKLDDAIRHPNGRHAVRRGRIEGCGGARPASAMTRTGFLWPFGSAPPAMSSFSLSMSNSPLRAALNRSLSRNLTRCASLAVLLAAPAAIKISHTSLVPAHSSGVRPSYGRGGIGADGGQYHHFVNRTDRRARATDPTAARAAT